MGGGAFGFHIVLQAVMECNQWGCSFTNEASTVFHHTVRECCDELNESKLFITGGLVSCEQRTHIDPAAMDDSRQTIWRMQGTAGLCCHLR